MQELEISEEHVGAVWWLIMWRIWAGETVGMLGIALIINLIGITGWHPAISGIASLVILAILFKLVWWPFVVGMALRKKYHGFRIMLVPLEPPPAV